VTVTAPPPPVVTTTGLTQASGAAQAGTGLSGLAVAGETTPATTSTGGVFSARSGFDIH
jgi:hypothetical protein